MNSNQVKSTILIFIIVIMAIVTSGCIHNVGQQPEVQKNASIISALETPAQITGNALSADNSAKIPEFVQQP